MLSLKFIQIVLIMTFFQSINSNYLIDLNESTLVFNHFWKNTGLCPLKLEENAKFSISKDQIFNIAYIASLSNRGISHIRIHWLLDFISIQKFQKNYFPTYNFKKLDKWLDWITDRKLYVIFELMGNPSDYFTDFTNSTQILLWNKLIKKLVNRYLHRYGANIIKNWVFESWNEPDLRMYNKLNFTLEGYINYLESSRIGLKNNREKINLKFGGPAGLFKSKNHHPLCWGILEYCTNLTCPFDFITYHGKGENNTKEILDKGLQIIQTIQESYPKLQSLPLGNDEADPLVNWSKNESWRGDVRYAAMVVKTIIDHHKKIVRKKHINFSILSNDNAFLNFHPYYFTQRTLLVRFQMNNTQPKHLQFIRKPVLIAMGLLSYLDEAEVIVQSKSNLHPNLNYLASMSTKSSGRTISVIFTFVNDTNIFPNITKNIEVTIKNIPFIHSKYVVYYLDNIKTNPFEQWKSFGSPVFPDNNQLNRLRSHEGPYRYFPVSNILGNELNLSISMSVPSVALLHICSGNFGAPGPVMELKVFNVTYNQVLLFWSDEFVSSKCIKTYEIEFCKSSKNECKFRRINEENIIFLSFQYDGSLNEIENKFENTIGSYRVRAVDYWDQKGLYSNIVDYK